MLNNYIREVKKIIITTGIYDSLFKTIILENSNFDYIKEIIYLVTNLKVKDLQVLNIS